MIDFNNSSSSFQSERWNKLIKCLTCFELISNTLKRKTVGIFQKFQNWPNDRICHWRTVRFRNKCGGQKYFHFLFVWQIDWLNSNIDYMHRRNYVCVCVFIDKYSIGNWYTISSSFLSVSKILRWIQYRLYEMNCHSDWRCGRYDYWYIFFYLFHSIQRFSR